MLKASLSGFVVLLASMLSINASADNGAVGFAGEVLAVGCDVAPGSEALMVNLGTLSISSFKGPGSTAGGASFQISVKNCDANLGSVGILFDGLSHSSSPTILAVAGPDSADGLGVALYEGDGVTPVALRIPSKSVQVTSQRDAVFHFVARYMATSDVVTAGKVNATASFTLVYN